MSGYAGLGRVLDPATYAVCKQLFDQNTELRRRLTALEAQVAALPPPGVSAEAVRAYVGAQVGATTGGASGTIDTTTAQIITVDRGRITEIA